MIVSDFDNEMTVKKNEDGSNSADLRKNVLSVSKGSLIALNEDSQIRYVLDHSSNAYTEFYTKNHTELLILLKLQIRKRHFQYLEKR
jgi:hypothetical protein